MNTLRKFFSTSSSRRTLRKLQYTSDTMSCCDMHSITCVSVYSSRRIGMTDSDDICRHILLIIYGSRAQYSSTFHIMFNFRSRFTHIRRFLFSNTPQFTFTIWSHHLSTCVHSTETSVRHSKSSQMWPSQMCRSLYRWGVIASPACPCGESHQTPRHIVEECPLTAFPGGLRRLHEAGPDALEWLSKLSMKL